ncbi:MAG TPA: ankyrin repeat domain-containing protein [Bryobacteraceae bacterium]
MAPPRPATRPNYPNWPEADVRQGASLHAAARIGDREMVELLLAHGADPNGHVNSAGNAVYAARTPEMRALLMARGGTLDPYDLVWLDEDDEVMRRVTEDPSSAELGCGGVFTAVCTRGKQDLLLRLLDAGGRNRARTDSARRGRLALRQRRGVPLDAARMGGPDEHAGDGRVSARPRRTHQSP